MMNQFKHLENPTGVDYERKLILNFPKQKHLESTNEFRGSFWNVRGLTNYKSLNMLRNLIIGIVWCLHFFKHTKFKVYHIFLEENHREPFK